MISIYDWKMVLRGVGKDVKRKDCMLEKDVYRVFFDL